MLLLLLLSHTQTWHAMPCNSIVHHHSSSRRSSAQAVSALDPGGWNTGQRRHAQLGHEAGRRPATWSMGARPCLALEAAQVMTRPGSNTFLFPSRKRGPACRFT